MIWFYLSQTSCYIYFVSYWTSNSNCLRSTTVKPQKMKWLWVFTYYGQIYVTFGSVVAGFHCIGFKDATLIELHTMNNYLTWFYLSQTSFHSHFVSNYPSYSLCLRPSIIFSLSQTNRYKTKRIWQLVWDKVNMKTSMRQSEYDNLYETKRIWQLEWDKTNLTISMRQS